MATADAGLFGPTPWEIQQAQQQQLQTAAANYAQQSPFQRAAQGMFTAGGQLGGMGAQALGGVNVAQQQAQQQQEALQGADLQTPEGLRAAAKKMLDIGNQKSAYLLSQKAAELEKEKADIDLKKAQATRALRPPSFREYESERLMSIINDPEASQEEKDMAQKRLDALNAKAMGQGMGTPQFKAGTDGIVYRMDKQSGQATPVLKPDGTPLMAAEASPELKAKMAEASATGKALGTASAGATVDLIDAVPMAEVQLRQLDQLINHPGLSGAVGVGIPKALQMPGTKEADFAARFDQIKGGVFLQAFKSLRGGGQITDVEGAKATQALLRAQTTQSETEFKDAIREYMDVIKQGIERLKKKSALSTVPVAPMPQVSASSPAAPMPQGAVPTTPVAPMPNAQPNFSGLTTPQQVKDQYKSGKITKQQANAILDDMKSRGLF